MNESRPFTADSLAERWGCSGETVRQMVKSGRLPGFRVGRMIRITAQAVEDYECQRSASDGSGAASASTGPATMDAGGAISLRHATERPPRPRPSMSTAATHGDRLEEPWPTSGRPTAPTSAPGRRG